MKALVTGGSGFIGTHLCGKLTQMGWEVIVFDLEAPAFDGTTWIDGDIRKPNQLREAIIDCDVVFHLAALTSVPESIEHPATYYETNVLGAENVLAASEEAGVASVILASSAAVYGNHEGIASESTACLPTSPYGLTKLVNEHQARIRSATGPLRTVALRLFNVFGQGQDPHGPYASVIPKFLELARQNKPLTIFGDGEQVRDFVPVGLVAEAFVRAAEHNETTGTINICTGNATSVRDIANCILSFLPNAAKPIFMPTRPGDVVESVGNSDLQTKCLGELKPPHLQEEIRAMLGA